MALSCPKCNGAMAIDQKGWLACPVCGDLKQSLQLKSVVYKDFEFYEVQEAENIQVDEIVLKEDVEGFLKKGVKISIKGE